MIDRDDKNRLSRDARGAVYVEFLIVFLPLFIMFMSLVQLAFVQVANVVTKHAAVQAARAAIVVLPDDPAFYGNTPVNKVAGDRKAVIDLAAKGRLAAVAASPDVSITFPTTPGGGDNKTSFKQDDLVRVQVRFNYACKIPIGNRFVCDLFSQKKVLKAEAAMPLQGAGYEY